jgi:hypothetical protein
MPVLGYFAVVGAALTALLFAADAYMPKTGGLSFASNFEGLPASYKGEPKRRPAAAPHIAPAPAIAERTSFALAAATPAAAAPAAPAPQVSPPVAQHQPVHEAAKPAAKPRVKVAHRKPQRQDEDDWFGGNNSRRDVAFGSRDPFSSREPSWRDSWAAGSFDQARETRSSRRSAARPNNDFWSFR